MSDPELTPDVLDLFERACNGTLAEAERDQLQSLLKRDEQIAAQYLDYASMHAEMYFLVAAQRAAQPRKSATVAPPAARPVVLPLVTPLLQTLNRPRVFSVLVATVTCVSLLLTFAQVRWGGDRETAESPVQVEPGAAKLAVARLTGSRGSEWASASFAATAAQALPVGDSIRLKAGVAEITFDTGARVLLQGPAQFTIQPRNALTLERGRLTAQVEGQRAQGFIVHTRDATFVDLGTEFAVSVAADGPTEGHVFVGRVDVELASGGRRVLVAGQALRIAAQAVTQLAADAARFPRGLAEPDQMLRLSNLQWHVGETEHFAGCVEGPRRSTAQPFQMAVTPGASDPTVMVNQLVAIDDLPGRSVSARLYARHESAADAGGRLAEGQRLDLRLVFRRGDNSVIAMHDRQILLSSDPTDKYLARSVSAIAPDEAERVSVHLIFRTAAPQSTSSAIYVDDAALVIGPPTNVQP